MSSFFFFCLPGNKLDFLQSRVGAGSDKEATLIDCQLPVMWYGVTKCDLWRHSKRRMFGRRASGRQLIRSVIVTNNFAKSKFVTVPCSVADYWLLVQKAWIILGYLLPIYQSPLLLQNSNSVKINGTDCQWLVSGRPYLPVALTLSPSQRSHPIGAKFVLIANQLTSTS